MQTTSDNASAEMPRYKCHKAVWALKIGAYEVLEDGSVRISPADKFFTVFTTQRGIAERFHGTEEDQGYYVVYKDGYCSWSPTKAFEDGYTKIEAGENEYLNIQLQDGPIKEKGVNGCQIDDVITYCRDKIIEFNNRIAESGESFACAENESAIQCLDGALLHLAERTAKRTAAGVEGTDKPLPAKVD